MAKHQFDLKIIHDPLIMAKDPAFLFYSQDFIVGIQTMTFEDRGKYISLLCMMHQQGRMKEETIRFLVGSISDNLKSKFCIDENGFWFNKRLESESEKRKIFTESRRNNGLMGGRPKEKLKPKGKPKNNHMVNHMEDVNEDVNKKEKGVKIPEDLIRSFIPIVKEWIEYKKERKETYQQKGLDKFCQQLSKWSGNNPVVAQKIIDNSIANNWAGAFELKEEKSFGKKEETAPISIKKPVQKDFSKVS